MGALTTTSDLMAEEWIPEDDLLLKNAIEAGASLASLAKGAVPFSRRFDVEQLEKRWRTLLYGLGSPEEVSARVARIAEVELELAASNPPKANRTCNPKGKESSPGIKKRVSARHHYYAMRKRIRSEPYSADLGFLLPHNLNAGADSDNGKPQCDDLAFGEPMQNHYEHLETGYDGFMHHSFHPGMVSADSVTNVTNGDVSHHAFHLGNAVPPQDELLDGMQTNCLYGYTENMASVPVDEAVCNNGDKVYSNILGETRLEAAGESVPNPYENDDMGSKGLTNFESINDDPHAEFVGNDNIGSQVSDCTDSFHQLRYSSPSGLPIWRTMEDISTPGIAMDRHYEVKDQGVLAIDDNKTIDAPGFDGMDKLNDGMCDAGLNDQTIISEGDFMNFPDTYMEFSDDDILFMDVDDKDIVDRSCIDGLSFLSSPSDLNQDGVANASDPRATNVPETGLATPEAACLGESDFTCTQMHSDLDNCHSDPVLDPNMPSTSHIAKPLYEFMICTLNTEDPEIPCNDHVIFPAEEFSPLLSTDFERSCREETGFISSSKVISADASAVGGDFVKVKDEQLAIAPPSISSVKASSNVLPKAGEDYMVEAEPYEGDPIVGVSRCAGIAVDGPNSLTPATSATNPASIATLREEKTVRCFQKPGSPETFEDFLENQLLQASIQEKVCPPSIADSCKEEPNMQLTSQTPLLTHADLVSPEVGFPDSVAGMPTSDQEDEFSDSEDDVPIYSDVETMIIDMDLDPCDQEPFLFTKEVPRYQCVDTKKTIVKLEQAAQSCRNRAISSHGALAVFFGKHLKYFIKDPEVSLGRQTEDVKVDIDLGREGRANRISRRQAIIKMDEDGTFFLKNTGKFPIIVSSKEVPPRKRIHLLSGCLVEIKDMNFEFHVNDRAVRQYIKNQRESSQENNASFDWKPNHNL